MRLADLYRDGGDALGLGSDHAVPIGLPVETVARMQVEAGIFPPAVVWESASQRDRFYRSLGATRVGEFTQDSPEFAARIAKLSARVRQMNGIRPRQMTVDQARQLLAAGQAAVSDAIRTGTAARSVSAMYGAMPTWAKFLPPAYLFAAAARAATPPNSASRQKVYWKLDWHDKAVGKLASSPDALYPHGDDLKNWVAQAFVEEAVSPSESATLDALWAAMWRDVEERAARLAAIPGRVLEEAGDFVKSATWPVRYWWVLALGGVAVLGVVGFGVYKVALVAAPAAAPVLAGRLPSFRRSAA